MKLDKLFELPFPPGHVYDAWVCPDTVIPPATRTDINPTVGGHYRLYVEMEDRCSRAEGVFFAVEPERRVRYTWEWDRDGEITEIDVTFDDGAEGTTLHIQQSGFRSEASRDLQDSSWDDYVEQLSSLLQQRAALPISA